MNNGVKYCKDIKEEFNAKIKVFKLIITMIVQKYGIYGTRVLIECTELNDISIEIRQQPFVEQN